MSSSHVSPTYAHEELPEVRTGARVVDIVDILVLCSRAGLFVLGGQVVAIRCRPEVNGMYVGCCPERVAPGSTLGCWCYFSRRSQRSSYSQSSAAPVPWGPSPPAASRLRPGHLPASPGQIQTRLKKTKRAGNRTVGSKAAGSEKIERGGERQQAGGRQTAGSRYQGGGQ